MARAREVALPSGGSRAPSGDRARARSPAGRKLQTAGDAWRADGRGAGRSIAGASGRFAAAALLLLPVEAADQRLGDLGVELRPGAARQLGDGLGVRVRLAVRAVGRDRAVGVAGQDDAAAER